MKFMVCRKDAIDRAIKSSELFPHIVTASPDTPPDEIVRLALDSKWPDYQPVDKSYYVVPMSEAVLVSFRRPRPPLEVIVERI